jgi:hypothetical protein
MVGVSGFEPPTSWSQTMRASHCATPRTDECKYSVLALPSQEMLQLFWLAFCLSLAYSTITFS